MKKLLALVLVAGLLPTALLAKGNHPMAGCGLAYVLFASKDNTQGIQILASTTNNSISPQSFGITSGTSGCTEDGAVKFAKEAELYAEINLKDISRDMVSGGGEYLTAFAGLLSVPAAKRPAFFQLVQKNYAVLFPTAQTGSTEMLSALQAQLAAHPELLS